MACHIYLYPRAIKKNWGGSKLSWRVSSFNQKSFSKSTLNGLIMNRQSDVIKLFLYKQSCLQLHRGGLQKISQPLLISIICNKRVKNASLKFAL